MCCVSRYSLVLWPHQASFLSCSLLGPLVGFSLSSKSTQFITHFNLKFDFTPIKVASVCEVEQEGKEASLLKWDVPVWCAGLMVTGLKSAF